MKRTYVDVALDVLQDMLTPGPDTYEIIEGVPAGSSIVGASVDDRLGIVRLFFDRMVDEPVIRRVHKIPAYP